MGGYSGKFVLRVPEDLHLRLSREAGRRKISLNRLCADLLQSGLDRPEEMPAKDRYGELVSLLRKKFGGELLGLYLFGSQVTGHATEDSDFDFLIVVSRKVPLSRALYRWWDESVVGKEGEEWSPQFVYLPDAAHEAGGLWLEAAMAHRKIWEKGRRIEVVLKKLRGLMDRDLVRRHYFQGQPYWVWRRDEAA